MELMYVGRVIFTIEKRNKPNSPTTENFIIRGLSGKPRMSKTMFHRLKVQMKAQKLLLELKSKLHMLSDQSLHIAAIVIHDYQMAM